MYPQIPPFAKTRTKPKHYGPHRKINIQNYAILFLSYAYNDTPEAAVQASGLLSYK
jgi:hypothetical protein